MSETKIVVEMDVYKKCKSCVRFGAKGVLAAEICAAIYVQNEGLDKLGNPERIRVTIEAV